MEFEPDNRIDEFRQVAKLAGVDLSDGAVLIQPLTAPHKSPTSLPKGKMAVYMFSFNKQCLKVGKVGPRSHARYTSQHYRPSSSRSNLAKSILAAPGEIGVTGLTDETVGAWIRANVDRTNFVLDATWGIPVLTLLEAFLQCRLKPRFEGFESQR